jgi:CheY-like chemotaxis protein
MDQQGPGTILLIEDEATDAAMIRRGFEKVKVINPIFNAKSGDEALAYLSGTGQFQDRIEFPLPVLILLDLKLPGMTGLQILQWRRSQRDIKRIPVVVLTGDEDPSTINAAYDAGANSYLLKPGSPADIARVVDLIQRYWIGLNEQPQLVMRAGESQ